MFEVKKHTHTKETGTQMVDNQEIREFVDLFTNELVNFSVKTWGFSKEFIAPNIRLHSAAKFKNSSGGTKFSNGSLTTFMNLQIANAKIVANKNKEFRFVEYDHIKYDKDIGDFTSNIWQLHIAALIAHEFAHCLQFSGETPRLFSHSHGVQFIRNLKEEGHGNSWQFFYKIFRVNFVNNNFYKTISPPVKLKRTVSKSWKVERQSKWSGTLLTYYNKENKIMGHLFYKKNRSIKFLPNDSKHWINLNLFSVVEARKQVFGI